MPIVEILKIMSTLVGVVCTVIVISTIIAMYTFDLQIGHVTTRPEGPPPTLTDADFDF
jgi:hypothetical protein